MAKYTPGPWTYKEYEPGDIGVYADVPEQDCSYTVIGSVRTTENARLIAAAPELLAVLQKLIVIDAYSRECVVIEAAKVIRKALGE